MNIRQAIFASVASAGVLASGWLGGTAPATPSTASPASNRVGPAIPGTIAARGAASDGRTSTASGTAGQSTSRMGADTATLSTVRRQQLRGSQSVQLVSGPGYTAAGYAGTLQASIDGGRV